MSAKSFLVHGDIVFYQPALQGGAVLTGPTQVPVVSTSKNLALFRGITLKGDEAKWILPACPYVKPGFDIPGVLMCKISKLNQDQISNKVKENNREVLKVGSMFDTMCQVVAPATYIDKVSGAPVSDPQPQYTGKGKFIQLAPSKAES